MTTFRSKVARFVAKMHAGPLETTVPARALLVDTPFGQLYLDEDDQVVTPLFLARGWWEPGDTKFFQERLRPGMTFVDIGAHAGYFSVLAAGIVGEKGRVLAFEPNPRNFELLQANLRGQAPGNASCFPWAVGAEEGLASLYLAVDNSGDHRTYPSEENRTRITVRSVALDTVRVLEPPLDAVKIDIQGAEEAAVRGMAGLLSSSPDVFLAVEFWPYGMSRFGSDPREVLSYYRSLGFVVRAQDPEVAGIRDWTDTGLLEFCRQKDGQQHATVLLTRR